VSWAHTGEDGELPLLQSMDSDEKSHRAVTEAMKVIGFSPEEVDSVHRILAAILHLVSLVGRATSPQGCPARSSQG
jgi:myosin-1